MTDRITLAGLRVRGRHGVFEHERRDGQEFVVDVTLDVDLRVPAATDRLTDTIDYGSLADRVAEIVAGEPMNLIESVAARLVQECLRDHRVEAAEVTLHKPNAPIPHAFGDVSVTLRRARVAP
ncbi:MAG: dihydroneopterin aldolase [Mycobacteriales bacterium]